jgi:hypothetical protein
MADPLSITANIIAVIQITANVIKYLNEVKDAPKDRERCRTTLWNHYNLLLSLRFRLEAKRSHDDDWYTAIRALGVQNGPIEQYGHALKELLPKVSGSGGGLRKVGKALIWTFSKKEVDDILSRLERLKSHVLIALELDHL